MINILFILLAKWTIISNICTFQFISSWKSLTINSKAKILTLMIKFQWQTPFKNFGLSFEIAWRLLAKVVVKLSSLEVNFQAILSFSASSSILMALILWYGFGGYSKSICIPLFCKCYRITILCRFANKMFYVGFNIVYQRGLIHQIAIPKVYSTPITCGQY